MDPSRRVPTITLLTDFGGQDTYVGQMKGVLLRRLGTATLVDLTHLVEPGAVDQGAYLLANAFRAFPPGTIHVAVVDPGVGTSRKGVALSAHGHRFVGPDNGLLTRAVAGDASLRVHQLEPARFISEEPSATFHGRDVFAPAAARLALTGGLDALGPALDPQRLIGHPYRPLTPVTGATVPVAHVDRFGNVALDVKAAHLESPREAWAVETESTRIKHWHRTFGDAGDDGPFLLVNAAGDVEIAIRGGSAADRLDLSPGDPVTLRRL